MLVVFAGQLVQGTHSFKLLMYLPSGQVHEVTTPLVEVDVNSGLHVYVHVPGLVPVFVQPLIVTVPLVSVDGVQSDACLHAVQAVPSAFL